MPLLPLNNNLSHEHSKNSSEIQLKPSTLSKERDRFRKCQAIGISSATSVLQMNSSIERATTTRVKVMIK